MIPFLLVFNNWALLFLRLAVGAIMLAHGYPKIKKLKDNSANFSKMGFKPGWLWGTIVAVVELVGGVLILLGAFTQIAAALFAVVMLVAMIWKKINEMKFVSGYELDLILLVSSLILVTMGGGSYALLF